MRFPAKIKIPSRVSIEISPGGPSWRLEPECGVEIKDGETYAVALPFWLRLEPVRQIRKCRWIRLRYASGLFDEPVRPLIRFDTRSGNSFIQPMNGAILGSAEWIGRVPDETVSIFISPGRRLGRFAFRVERVDVLSRPRLLQGGFFSDPLWAFWAVRSRMVDSRQEAWQSVKYALGGTPLHRYHGWAARMERPFDPEGLDRPRGDWSKAPQLRLVISLDGRLGAFMHTLRALRAQVHEQWSLQALVPPDADPDLVARFREEADKDPRLTEINSARNAFADDDRVALVQGGDVMPPYALAAVAETLIDRPDLKALYSDEDAVEPSGEVAAPILKPDWSPVFFGAAPYVGRLTFLRHGDLVAAGLGAADLISDEQGTLERVLTMLPAGTVGHLRRILYRRRKPMHEPAVVMPTPIRKHHTPEPQWPEVSIVIPTRDRAHLLASCMRGLKEKTDYPSFNVVIVDNGSTQPQALALLDGLRAEARFRVLDRPEPFNYAKLSNDGARATNSPMLVFLNNDIRMIGSGWLKAIVRLAMQPQVGVVGAKLLFPNGRVQHAGIVLGMGGISGHIYRRRPAREPGYLGQAATTREMAAVTGACIAIDRSKFEAVGGFDAENLPVDLNDIDLCLRVAERGWTNIWAADAVLTHVQSASRGIERNPFDQYRQERTYFIQRWAEAIRDDPYFHPALSLSAHRPILA